MTTSPSRWSRILGAGSAADAGSGCSFERAEPLRQGSRFSRCAGERLYADRGLDRLLRSAAILAILGHSREAGCSVLLAPARAARQSKTDLRRPPLVPGIGLGLRRRNGDACVAANGQRTIRPISKAQDHT